MNENQVGDIQIVYAYLIRTLGIEDSGKFSLNKLSSDNELNNANSKSALVQLEREKYIEIHEIDEDSMYIILKVSENI